MSTKEAVIEIIKRLPDDVTLPDIMAELNFRQQVDEGLSQLDAGQGLSHEEAIRQLSQWLN
jgi:predicted transcriptional regulator